MCALMQSIPGLQQHRRSSRAAVDVFDGRAARDAVDRVMAWMRDSAPEELLEWLMVNHPDQLSKVMAPWREIDVCAGNRDLAGVKRACAEMIDALQRGVRLYNSAPVPVREEQLEML